MTQHRSQTCTLVSVNDIQSVFVDHFFYYFWIYFPLGVANERYYVRFCYMTGKNGTAVWKESQSGDGQHRIVSTARSPRAGSSAHLCNSWLKEAENERKHCKVKEGMRRRVPSIHGQPVRIPHPPLHTLLPFPSATSMVKYIFIASTGERAILVISSVLCTALLLIFNFCGLPVRPQDYSVTQLLTLVHHEPDLKTRELLLASPLTLLCCVQ